MTFAPDFAFYRDDRPIGESPPVAFWDAMKVEAHDTLVQRSLTYPGLVTKGRMSRDDADRELRVSRAIAEDWRAAPLSATFPDTATWGEKIHCLRRDIAIRRNLYPQRVLKGQMTADEAERRLLLVEQFHDLLWHTTLLPEAVSARAATAEAAAMRQAA